MEKYLKTEDGEDLQIISDGRAVWVNDGQGCIARFSPVSFEIWSGDREPQQEMLEIRPGMSPFDKPHHTEWNQFAVLMLKHHKVVMPDLTDWAEFKVAKSVARIAFRKSLALELKEHSSATRSDLLFSGPYVEVKLLTIRPRRKLIFKALIPGGFTEGDKFGRIMATRLAREFCR